ncbi:MAG: efflux RND transporter periplasmic adaptor subunit [Planctomycetota bacterium]|jgi:Cu(I)/Ag(I) efflux system membrane fusion protein
MKNLNIKTWLNRPVHKVLIIVLIAFVLGYLIRGWRVSSQLNTEHIHAAQDKERIWTCSMHPQIRQPKPGKCPICFMDLVPINSGGEVGSREISFSQDALKLMEIQTSPVERKFVEAQIRMVGKADIDETRLKHITAWVPGRIDRLYVDFTGTQVTKGDHMVYLYSPELISAQAEFLQAAKSVQNIKPDSSELIKRSIRATLEAASEKLRLLGLTEQQIEKIEETGQPTDYITIYAPIGGVVINKHVTEGTYVQTGTKVYTIADLSQLWVQLDAYESDMMWIRYGQDVEFTTEAYPGEVFKGQISFISPTVNPKTRTIKVRLNVSNPEEKLKPDMFVRAIVRSKIALGGKVMAADMAGKWICPMHPSVVKDNAGKCDICQMDLVTTESLGYVKADLLDQAPLAIPATVPLITGKRAVVYVQKPDTEKPTFEGREVVLGPRAGDYYLVKEGLVEGEIVVTKGNFKIDSALQIQAKPSMMNPRGQKAPIKSHNHNH